MKKFDDSEIHKSLTKLGEAKSLASKVIETFEIPGDLNLSVITISSKEMTANCPKTGQPDFYSIWVRYIPNTKCIESKAFKLYLMTFRNEGHFIEALSKIVLDELVEQTNPKWMEVEIEMAPRGGITINAKSEYKEDVDN